MQPLQRFGAHTHRWNALEYGYRCPPPLIHQLSAAEFILPSNRRIGYWGIPWVTRTTTDDRHVDRQLCFHEACPLRL